MSELTYDAWGVIANVSEGDWTKQPQEWQDAAKRWRDDFHASLAAQPTTEEVGKQTRETEQSD